MTADFWPDNKMEVDIERRVLRENDVTRLLVGLDTWQIAVLVCPVHSRHPRDIQREREGVDWMENVVVTCLANNLKQNAFSSRH